MNIPQVEGGGTTPATLFVMNDATNLYLGVRVARSQLNTGTIGFGLDQVVFEFDNDHDNGPPEEGDGILVLPGYLLSQQGFFDEVRTTRPPCPAGVGLCGLLDTDVGGTSDGEGVAANDGSFSFFEISHPLSGPDGLNDFSLAPGSTVGFVAQIGLSTVIPACTSDCWVSTGLPMTGRGDIVIASPMAQVGIDIKPGSFPNSINLRSQGSIPIAILSTPTFNAPAAIDPTSPTFGRTGDEQSLAGCNFWPQDVNGDTIPDLVCRFNTQGTGFLAGDTAGILKARKHNNEEVTGTDSVKIIP